MALSDRLDQSPTGLRGPRCSTRLWLQTLPKKERTAFATLAARTRDPGDALTVSQLWRWCREDGYPSAYVSMRRHIGGDCGCSE